MYKFHYYIIILAYWVYC